MGVQLSEVARRIIEQPVLAHFATLMRDGSPQVTPVWVDYDGRYILINTEAKRQKTRNLKRDPRVAISVVDPDNPYGRLIIRGRVVTMQAEGAWEHIDKLAMKYRGTAYPRKEGESRLILKIEPDHVTVSARWA
jgi:PPOX class probable F420-dependent enzyme